MVPGKVVKIQRVVNENLIAAVLDEAHERTCINLGLIYLHHYSDTECEKFSFTPQYSIVYFHFQCLRLVPELLGNITNIKSIFISKHFIFNSLSVQDS